MKQKWGEFGEVHPRRWDIGGIYNGYDYAKEGGD